MWNVCSCVRGRGWLTGWQPACFLGLGTPHSERAMVSAGYHPTAVCGARVVDCNALCVACGGHSYGCHTGCSCAQRVWAAQYCVTDCAFNDFRNACGRQAGKGRVVVQRCAVNEVAACVQQTVTDRGGSGERVKRMRPDDSAAELQTDVRLDCGKKGPEAVCVPCNSSCCVAAQLCVELAAWQQQVACG
jgi:hypothetical protein